MTSLLVAAPPRSPWIARTVITLAGLALLVGLGLMVRKFLDKPAGRKTGVQSVALLKQPPPPPPKPPEKPPEPPKVKEEVKLPEPKAEPKPDEAKQPDEKPASDKPLGVDADGAAGADGFGLVGSKGGRDLLTTGGGGGAYYSGLLQRQFFEALSRNRKVLKEEFRVVVRIWLADDGRVQKSDIVVGSGNAQVDDLIQATLAEMPALRDVPPSHMRPMQLRLSNRS
ncbi:TonB C-terminal domain-containing protein [Methylibium sp.]|uniref:TonB C-terminal domain-containing protein n=1 Tax=Methylibium sp. TaxID=2067992 RepID=UPI003D0A1DC2